MVNKEEIDRVIDAVVEEKIDEFAREVIFERLGVSGGLDLFKPEVREIIVATVRRLLKERIQP